MKKKGTLYSDGASRYNGTPRQISGAGAVLIIDNEEFKFQQFLGSQTNNQAEYEGIILGMTHARKKKVKELECFCDSLLVCKQLNGEWDCKHIQLKKWYNKAKRLTILFDKITITHINREKNTLADSLANDVIDNNYKKEKHNNFHDTRKQIYTLKSEIKFLKSKILSL